MSTPAHFNGFQTDFLGENLKVRMPRLRRHIRENVAPVDGNRRNILHYQNYSVVQHAARRFPIYTATNINGHQFRSLPRVDDWEEDPRIAPEHQLGLDFYRLPKSDFDRGHMTKREDVQWGATDEEAKKGALSTFFYTNAAPQVPKLNQQLWRSLEDYILKNQSIGAGLKVCMFTGPVLSEQDPVFVTKYEGQDIQIPTLFWKVIYFAKSDGELFRVAFLMGQEELLEKDGIVRQRGRVRARPTAEQELFMTFKKADIFQVDIKTIRALTGLSFTAANEPFKEKRPITLIRKKVQVRGAGGLGFYIDGLQA